MIIVDDIEQGSLDWLLARLGVLTASQIDQVITKTGKASAQSRGLAAGLAAESITKEPDEDFRGTYWTERGQALEGEAFAYFELQTNLVPRRVGFVYKDESRRTGCSPDGLVYAPAGHNPDQPLAGLELKCPSQRQHALYVADEKAERYTPQVQFSLWVTGLPAWYFMSYHPLLRPLLVEVKPDKTWQDLFDDYVPTVLAEVDGFRARLLPGAP